MERLIDLSGKKAIVTGGSRGVGRATALMLAKAGASVGIGFHSREKEAEEVAEACRGLGVEAWTQGGDLADPAEVEALFERGDREFDGLDIFIGNHGIWPPTDAAVETQRTSRPRIDALCLPSLILASVTCISCVRRAI